MTHKVVQRLDLRLRYSTLNQLTIDWSNIAPKDIVLTPPTKSVDNTILKHLNISIIELWCKIEDRYNAEGQIIVRTLWEQGKVLTYFVIRKVVKVLMLMLVLVPGMQIKMNMLVVVLVLLVVLVVVLMLLPQV